MKQLMDYVDLNGRTYYISTADTPDHGLETMVFECEFGTTKVKDWGDLYSDRYFTLNRAISGHKYVVDNLEECLEY
ncbi:hypothetical protein UT300012_32850 [Paraclostridium bifermentans]